MGRLVSAVSAVSAMAAIAVGVGLLVGGCGGGEVAVSPGVPVVVISIDTLRSDRLPAYGYDGVATPALDALRADSVLFERAYSHYPITLPSHTSIFTGQLPSVHGVRDNIGYTLDAEAHPYLPKILKENGYATGAAVSSFVLRSRSGLDAGFDLYDDSIETGSTFSIGSVQRGGGETLAIARDWLSTVEGEPFFLFLHLYEPHTPYTPPEPYASRYRDPYDGEVAAADAIVGDLVATLEEMGVYDEALIIVLSDHGEGLGDHGEEEHGILLYREVLQVPLMVKLPGKARAGERVASPVGLVDVAPTILELLGEEVPAAMDGVSLVGHLRGDTPPARPIYSETYYARLHMGWSELTSLIEGDHHYIEGPRPELFDLVADPGETTNILEAERRVYARLREAIEPFQSPLADPGEVDEETASKLAALGYLGGRSVGGDGPRPDPREKIPALADLGEAHRLIKEEKNAEAVAKLEGLLEEHPGMYDAWVTLGMANANLGRLPAAVAAYRGAIELAGPQPHLTTRLASIYLQMGQLTEAAEHARLALDSNPVWAHSKLAEVALVREDLAAAETEARQAAAARKTQVSPLILLTKVLLRRGKVAEARTTFTELEQELAKRTSQEDLPGLHFLRGDLAAREGRLAEAKREFLLEIEGHPEHLDTYARLAFLYAVEGDARRVGEVVRQMVQHDESPAAYALAIKTLRGLGDGRSASALLAHARGRFPASEQLATL